MMGSVSMPPTVTIDHVHSLLTILSKPDELIKTLEHLKTLNDEHDSKLDEIRNLTEGMNEREKDLKTREEHVAAEELRQADERDRLDKLTRDYERRISLLKQAAG